MEQFNEDNFNQIFLQVVKEQTLSNNIDFADNDKVYEVLDSLDVIEVVMQLEDEFNIEISDAEIDVLSNPETSTFKHFKDIVKSKIK